MSDTFEFGTDPWVKQLQTELNSSPPYAEAASKWEGDICFIIDPKGSALTDTVYMYLDLWHGECRQAGIVASPDEVSPEFSIEGTVKCFKDVIDGKVEPMKAILNRKLKLKGNMGKLMRNVKSANQLVLCCTQVPTTFPLE